GARKPRLDCSTLVVIRKPWLEGSTMVCDIHPSVAHVSFAEAKRRPFLSTCNRARISVPLRSPLTLRVLSIALAVLLVFPVLIAPHFARAQDATPVAGSPLAGVPDLLDSCDSIFGVVILDADGNVLLEHNPDLPFVSASLYKLV